MKAGAVAALLLATVGMVWGCVHKVGDPCYQGDAFCADGGTCLTCQQGKLAAYLCGGAKGCAIDKDRNVACDQSSNASAGGLCFPEYEGRAQCLNDRSGFLTCVQGVWTLTACQAHKGCQSENYVGCF